MTTTGATADQRTTAGREPGPRLLVAAGDEQLLELIDDQHRPLARISASSRSGLAPGMTTATSRPSRRNAGATPARASDDLPDPEAPTMATNPVASTIPRHSATSRSRPKNHSASSTS